MPATAKELEAAARPGNLVETHTFDGKVQLPASGKNESIAEDVCAMTVDGGVIIYGLGEDKNERLTVCAPFELAGVRERIDAVSQTGISEPPEIRTVALELPDDVARGYVVVVVPPSPRAPHQVTLRKDRRYYGRGDTGNRRLSESEVSRLYERRQRSEVDRDQLLQAAIDRSPGSLEESGLGVMNAFACPVLRDSNLLERAVGATPELQQNLLEAARRVGGHPGSYEPDLRKLMSWFNRGADGWVLQNDPEYETKPHRLVTVEVDNDGSGWLVCGRIADRETYLPGAPLRIMEPIAAGNLATFLALMGQLAAAAGYVGPIDVGVVLRKIHGGGSYSVRLMYGGNEQFRSDAYRATRRVAWASTLQEQPQEVAVDLLRRLFDVLLPGRNFDPFSQP